MLFSDHYLLLNHRHTRHIKVSVLVTLETAHQSKCFGDFRNGTSKWSGLVTLETAHQSEVFWWL